MLALELERAAQHHRLDPDAIFTRGRRRAPALPRRLRGRRDDRRLRDARVPRSVRHPAADHRRQRGDGRHRVPRRVASRWRSSRSASRCCATSRRARRSSSTRPATSTRASARSNPSLNPCIFEYVYLARPDSVIDGTSVYEARLRMGGELARKIRGIPEAQDIDVVIPIPDSSRPSALELAEHARQDVPRRLRQEPLHRPHVHHAGPGDAQEERAAEAEPDRHGVQGQGRAARRRFDRARHDVARDRADGARRRRAQGLFRLGEPAGALSERVRHRHAEPAGAGRDRPHRSGDRRRDRRRSPRLPGARRAEGGGARRQSACSATSRRRASTASTSPATSRPTTCRSSPPSATRRAARPNPTWSRTRARPRTEIRVGASTSTRTIVSLLGH